VHPLRIRIDEIRALSACKRLESPEVLGMSASVTTWLGKLKAGETDAAQELWRRYYASLVSLARRKLSGLPKRASDEEDVVLSAFHSFCEAVDAGRFPSLENRDDLWQLLVMHTARKAVDQRRYQGRLKRSAEPAGDIAVEEIVGDEPDPQFAVCVAEELGRLMQVLDEDLLRTIAQRKLEGYTNEEIAEQTGRSLRTVARKLTVIRALWSEALGIEAHHDSEASSGTSGTSRG
jgi:DNA-directed RNA polymerase specialized sigma24 family protein